jgi:hypothetical protein
MTNSVLASELAALAPFGFGTLTPLSPDTHCFHVSTPRCETQEADIEPTPPTKSKAKTLRLILTRLAGTAEAAMCLDVLAALRGGRAGGAQGIVCRHDHEGEDHLGDDVKDRVCHNLQPSNSCQNTESCRQLPSSSSLTPVPRCVRHLFLPLMPSGHMQCACIKLGGRCSELMHIRAENIR